MITLPDETCLEIIQRLDFSALNPFARVCRRHARMISDAALDLANYHVDTAYDDAKDSDGRPTLISRDLLPNGIPHGDISIGGVHTSTFRFTYSLGHPSFWRATVEDSGILWGHIMSPVYVDAADDDDFRTASTRVEIAGGRFVMCSKKGPTKLMTVLDDRIDTIYAPDIRSPKMLVVDGNISLKHTAAWWRQASARALEVWPDAQLPNSAILPFASNIVNLILTWCPGIPLPKV